MNYLRFLTASILGPLFLSACTAGLYEAAAEAGKKEAGNPLEELFSFIVLRELLDPNPNAIRNLRNNGLVESGFVMGTAGAGAYSVGTGSAYIFHATRAVRVRTTSVATASHRLVSAVLISGLTLISLMLNLESSTHRC